MFFLLFFSPLHLVRARLDISSLLASASPDTKPIIHYIINCPLFLYFWSFVSLFLPIRQRLLHLREGLPYTSFCTMIPLFSHPSSPLPPWRGPWIPSSVTTSFPPWQWGRRAPRRLLGRRKLQQNCGCPRRCHAVVTGLSCRGHRGCPWATTWVSVYPCHRSAGAPRF